MPKKLFINIIKYLIFNKDIFHRYSFVITFDYYTKVNIKSFIIYIYVKYINKIIINLRHISLCKSN